MFFLKAIAIVLAIASIWVLLARQMFPLPDNSNRKDSTAIAFSADTFLGSMSAVTSAKNPGKTGISEFAGGREAFAARIMLIRQARASIDLQYYIWRSDMTGTLMLDALLDAAERGVRVRLLLDDNGSDGLDSILSMLNEHENIEVRLFNPFTLRKPRWLGYTFSFFRLNRRMHNKSFTVDNAVSIIGGRNIADEYFDTGKNSLFVDLDVLATGKVVSKVSQVFDLFWASNSAYPAELLLGRPSLKPSEFRTRVQAITKSDQFHEYKEAIRDSEIVRKIRQKELDHEWANVDLVSDDPVKTLGLAELKDLMFPKLSALLGTPTTSIDLVTPYLVPGNRALGQYEALAKSGVKIRILTNSMEATDVVVVHAGYAKHRRQMLEAGIELYEMKAAVSPVLRPENHRLTGASSSSLHAKTFAVDGERVYVGSFNFDPRSVLLNTEMGFLIESSRSAEVIRQLFDSGVARLAYKPFLTDSGKIAWAEIAEDGTQIIHATEPNTSWYQRAGVAVIGILPVEWLL